MLEVFRIKDEVNKLAEIFRALGDPTRLKIVRILASQTARDIRVIDIAEMLGISQPAVSQHLKILKGVGILDSQRDGYRIYYNIDAHAFKKYKQLIDNMFEMAFQKFGLECNCEKPD